MLDILLTHSIARREGKRPFFFSRFKFQRMQEMGNTHYCFACLSQSGYKLDAQGNLTNIDKTDEWAFENHTEEHAPYVVGDADQFNDVRSWLEAKITPEFPFVVTVPQLP
jgi:hypothetical protein